MGDSNNSLTLHKKLIEKERARREAEHNIKHLAGRLKIIESEEQRVFFKINF
jgi:hypothetical protein